MALSPIDNRPAGPVAHVLEGQFAQNGVDVLHCLFLRKQPRHPAWRKLGWEGETQGGARRVRNENAAFREGSHHTPGVAVTCSKQARNIAAR